MEEKPPAPEPPVSKPHPLKPLAELWEELSWDIPFARTISLLFKSDRAVFGEAGMKRYFAVSSIKSVVLVIIASVCVYVGCEHGEKGKQAAEQARDKYFLALQPWQALAASIYTNAPPDQRVGMLLTNITEMQGALKRLESLASTRDPLKRRILNFVDTLDAFEGQWKRTNFVVETSVTCYSAFTEIYSDNLSDLCQFPSDRNRVSDFSSTNVANITAELRRLCNKL